ncbi:uncharacterized protein Fot_25516 [Forsythia ovata]|uniref:Uncharacterized protein n=1 Tax=Forsythia ovata TaxID=205694 RepID=A0ABD1U994_9LAMI
MEVGFLFPTNTHFSVSPVKITSDMQLKWLIELNKKHHTPLCITLVRREQPMNRHNVWDEAEDEMYHNGDDFWNTVEIAQDDDIYVPGTFSRSHLPRSVHGVEIHDAVGQVWQIRMDTRHNRIVRRLAGGWA